MVYDVVRGEAIAILSQKSLAIYDPSFNFKSLTVKNHFQFPDFKF